VMLAHFRDSSCFAPGSESPPDPAAGVADRLNQWDRRLCLSMTRELFALALPNTWPEVTGYPSVSPPVLRKCATVTRAKISRVIAYCVREWHVLTLEQALRMLTFVLASFWRSKFNGRGLLVPAYLTRRSRLAASGSSEGAHSICFLVNSKRRSSEGFPGTRSRALSTTLRAEFQ
jgi:hypothetical protein